MAGIYVHIPFCRQACHYCNFHFSTRLENTNEMVRAIVREATMRRDFTGPEPVSSVYLGGGTPSVLPQAQLDHLLETLYAVFAISSDAEVTLEANPDDLSAARLNELRSSPVNRLSIGIQSFRDQDLHWMNRAHTADQAIRCLDLASAAGFDQLSADLIYGTPGLDDQAWKSNLRQVFDRGIPHLSAYALTVEEGTALAHFVRTGKSPAPEDDTASRQFSILREAAGAAGYSHYEISNFCRNGAYARHNTAYWTGQPYLGLGPSAHSFDGIQRNWNAAHNLDYVRTIQSGSLALQGEKLQPADRLNEALMTGLRTTWGVNQADLEQRFGQQAVAAVDRLAQPWLDRALLVTQNGFWFLSAGGLSFADRIASDLFLVDEEAELVQELFPPALPQNVQRIAWWGEAPLVQGDH